jgi:hypothetical protein
MQSGGVRKKNFTKGSSGDALKFRQPFQTKIKVETG